MRYMLKYDTVHGRFPNTVEVAGDSIAVGGDKVKVFGERDPSNIRLVLLRRRLCD